MWQVTGHWRQNFLKVQSQAFSSALCSLPKWLTPALLQCVSGCLPAASLRLALTSGLRVLVRPLGILLVAGLKRPQIKELLSWELFYIILGNWLILPSPLETAMPSTEPGIKWAPSDE